MGVLGQSRDAGSAAVVPNATGPIDRTGFFSNIGAGFRQAVAGPHSTRIGQTIYEQKLYDDIIKALAEQGMQGSDTFTDIRGQKETVTRPFRNPYVSGPLVNLTNPNYNPLTNLYAGGDEAEKEQIWAAVQQARLKKPDFLKQFPDRASFEALAQKNRTRDLSEAQGITSRATTAGSVGGFIGGMAGSIASLDPENVVGAGFGTAAGKTVARTVIKRTVEGAGVNAAASLVATPGLVADAQRLGTEMTPGDIAHQTSQAAGIGAVFGGAHVVLPQAAGAVGSAVGTAADKIASLQPVRDALIARSISAGTIQDHSLLNDWMRTHNPNGIVDTSTPDERAAAHVILRDTAAKETSPLQPEAAGANDHRLDAVAQSLGVKLETPPVPSPAPIQTPTVRSNGVRAPASYDAAVHQAEGTGKNPDSSADGHFQFTKGTWLEYAPRVADTAGMSEAQILALRHDLPTAERAERLFRADNARYLRQRGIEDSPGNLSLAHFLGKSDAAKVLEAAPDTPVERVIDPRSFAANRKVLAGKSTSEVVAWAHKRIGAAVDLPVARADAVPDADLLDAGDYSDVPYERAMMKPDEVSTDAGLMQYKSGGDENGVTGKLKDVTAWNPINSSEILVWEANDGRRVVVDGHQRVGLAKRLAGEGQDITIPALVIREADGISPAQARVLGALRNINLGTGSLIDNARVLREVPDAAPLLKGAENRREIEGLSKLSYEAFGAAINDVIDPRVAAEIGNHAPDPSTHMAMVGLLHGERVSSPREAAAVVRQATLDGLGAPEEHQLGMFGDQPQQSLYVPIARILSAAAKKLREEKRTFKVLSDKAAKIEAAGNVLDKAANESKVIGNDEALAILERTAHSAGPVRNALIAAARHELSGARRADAVAQFLGELENIDLRAAARGATEDGAVREPSGETGSRDAAAEADRELASSHGPELFDHAVAARTAAEPFSDPIGEAAKQQTAILEHDLLMDIQAQASIPRDVSSDGFKTWFGDSKITDESGAPKVVYHGTTGDIKQFDASKLGANTGAESAGMGFFFTDDVRTAESYGHYAATDARVQELLRQAEEAEKRGDWNTYDAKVLEYEALDASFADPENRLAGQNTVPVYLKMDNPLRMDAHGENAVGFDIPGAIRKAQDGGHDGLIISNLDDAAGLTDREATHYVVFNPEQIRFAIGSQRNEPPPTLFDLPETGHRLSEEGKAKPIHEIMADAESDELAAKALRECLTLGGKE